MITPSFSTSQDDNFVYIRIRVPHIKISDVDINVDGCTFKFFLKPYFLRLVLPGEVMEDDAAKAQYDVSQGEVLVQLSKVTKGEHFDGLDMLTTLLVKSKRNEKPVMGHSLIQVMDDGDDAAEGAAEGEEEEEEEDDWEVEQELFDESAFEQLSLSGPKYGFANQSCGIFARFQGEALGVVELPSPDETPASQRHELRVGGQNLKFDEEHYLADFVSTDDLKAIFDYSPYYNEQYTKYKKFLKETAAETCTADRSSTGGAAEASLSNGRDQHVAAQEKFVTFSSEDLDRLKELPNKEYLLDRPLTRCTYLGLVDLMMAYAYNHRSTCGENTVESGWTVSKVACLLSWFEWFSSLKDVVVASARNMLAYPLYRHWKLVKLVLKDVSSIFLLGRRQILKCLLEIRCLLQDDENRYLLNDLYITDYCVWVQRCSHSKIKAIAERLAEMKLVKKDLGWQLSELEEAATEVLQENGDDDTHGDASDGSSSCSSSSDDSSSDSSDDDSDDDEDSNVSGSEDVEVAQNMPHVQDALSMAPGLQAEDRSVAGATAVSAPPQSATASTHAESSNTRTSATDGGLLDVGVLDKPTSITGSAYHNIANDTDMKDVGQQAADRMETGALDLMPEEVAAAAPKRVLIEEL
ncbi:protein SHQ1 homolog [Sycon ciliatum]|uniref:protein SHQ1 homolog n=1 Tax=Sycon ciliatum TaxID=27933 RepID=UPI0031F65AE4